MGCKPFNDRAVKALNKGSGTLEGTFPKTLITDYRTPLSKTPNFKYFCVVQQAFNQHIQVHFPHLKERPFLLACSGGVDSVVLAHLLAKSAFNFSIAHCNFGLRAAESDADEAFVRRLATQVGKAIFVTRFNTKDYVAKHKVSVMMAARTLRYTWFAEIMKAEGIAMLVTAHQADDNLETFLINLSRGTGLQGLTGIPEQTDTISRPLLTFSRETILAYAMEQGIAWREDSSNAETKYLRNKIRHQIIPLLKELHPTFLNNFEKTAAHLGQSSAMLEQHIQNIKDTIFEADGDRIKIEIAALKKLHPLKGYMFELFKPYGFTEWNDAQGLLTALTGKEIRSKTHCLIRDRSYLLLEEIVPKNKQIYEIDIQQPDVKTPVQLTLEEVQLMEEVSEKILYVDKASLKYPITVRKWQTGDYFYPLGMQNKKKLSKFFKDEKISTPDKERQWLLCAGNDIAWVMGLRADDRFKVTKNTECILKFTLIK